MMSGARRNKTNLRGLAFWTVDKVRGGAKSRLKAQISSVMDSAQHASLFQKEALRLLLKHAIETVPAYRHIPPGAPLERFPIIDKNFVRENTTTMLSTQYTHDELVKASTSGSTGTPLVVYQGQRKRLHRTVEAIYFGETAGFALGTPLYNMKIWSGRNHQSWLTHRLRNTYPVDTLQLHDDNLAAVLERISRARSSVSIIAYSSVLESIARYLERSPFSRHLPIQTIIGQSEALPEVVRIKLRELTGADVVARYGTEEVGIIGQQRRGSADYVVNKAGVHLEILALDSDEPARPGTLGRIVVTDLHNFGMPMIRYDTGDLGEFALLPSGDIDTSRLASVHGRIVDQLYDSTDRPLSPFVFYKFIWRYSAVRQFQIVQHDRATYTLRINVDAGFDRFAELKSDFAEHLGDGAEISVEIVDEIPVLRSGKRQQVVQLYRPRDSARGS